MKPAEYAKELGISRQAVYAKIKKGILSSKNVEGKLYIVVDNDSKNETTFSSKEKTLQNKVEKIVDAEKDYKALLKAKDETIAVLKETVVDLKESNKQISTTLRGEIDLLKDAFHEMRILYTHQLEHKNKREEEAIEIEADIEQEAKVKWIGVKKFFKRVNVTKEKAQEKLIKRLNKAYKKGDDRLMKVEGKLKLNAEKSYEDILK